MKPRVLTAAIVLLACAPAFAQRTVSRTFSSDQTFGLAAGGTFYLENPVGNIVIYGKDTPNVEAMLFKTIEGADKDAVEEGRRQTTLIVGGDDNGRSVRTTIAAGSTRGWTASVAWRIGVPRTANVRILTRAGDHIKISGMRAGVQVKNFNGSIHLDDVIGAAIVESVNGSIFYQSPQLRGNVLLSTVNGGVTVTVPPQAGFRWVAETIKGDIRTNLPARGTFFGNTFRGTVNAPGGPTISTGSLMGNVQLFAEGRPVRTAQSVRKTAPIQTMAMRSGPTQPVVRGRFQFATSLGDVRVQQILGDADIFTGAGEVQLGAVSGACRIVSNGGPLQLGEVFGPLDLKTRAGDILVDTARRGGQIETKGGTIRLLYTSGPTRLISGGGDITVRQAAAAVDADTLSGDITIAVDSTSKSQRVDAKTAKGNVILTVTPQFAADIDATILTSDPEADTFLSDIPGLSVSRDQVGGKTRVRATGKINGGGEKVVLHATDGDIRISTGPVAPTVVTRR
ncbi:MAG TPA: DUF4097 family beta strand repeat-containing protein [Thermoanaerobaculia bacterium]|jgi:DUF4097 and DUF4098 domain-containing protein YvlB|nr:DUF4097 family beta strand repeat-containing protein [Thermoanaerobaculia bacterium]